MALKKTALEKEDLMAHVFALSSFLNDPAVRQGNKNLVRLQLIIS
jgi:hypothetical protein